MGKIKLEAPHGPGDSVYVMLDNKPREAIVANTKIVCVAKSVYSLKKGVKPETDKRIVYSLCIIYDDGRVSTEVKDFDERYTFDSKAQLLRSL